MKTYVIVMIVSITIIVIGIVLYFLLREKKIHKIVVAPFAENFQQSISETYAEQTRPACSSLPGAPSCDPFSSVCVSVNNFHFCDCLPGYERVNSTTCRKITPAACAYSIKPKPLNANNPVDVEFASKLIIKDISIRYCYGHRSCLSLPRGQGGGYLYQNGKHLSIHNLKNPGGQVIPLKDLHYDVGINVSHSDYPHHDEVGIRRWDYAMEEKNNDDKIDSSTDTCHSYEFEIHETNLVHPELHPRVNGEFTGNEPGTGKAIFAITLEQK